jgi:hypothetical protein
MRIANRILIATGIAGTLLLSGVTACGQKGKEMTMTGCLTKGTDNIPQHFSFTDQKSGKKWTVTGEANLEEHAANHTVTITGEPTAKVFNVKKIEHVSASCEATQPG